MKEKSQSRFWGAVDSLKLKYFHWLTVCQRRSNGTSKSSDLSKARHLSDRSQHGMWGFCHKQSLLDKLFLVGRLPKKLVKSSHLTLTVHSSPALSIPVNWARVGGTWRIRKWSLRKKKGWGKAACLEGNCNCPEERTLLLVATKGLAGIPKPTATGEKNCLLRNPISFSSSSRLKPEWETERVERRVPTYKWERIPWSWLCIGIGLIFPIPHQIIRTKCCSSVHRLSLPVGGGSWHPLGCSTSAKEAWKSEWGKKRIVQSRDQMIYLFQDVPHMWTRAMRRTFRFQGETQGALDRQCVPPTQVYIGITGKGPLANLSPRQ